MGRPKAGVPRFPSYIGERIDGKFVSTATPQAKVRRVDAITSAPVASKSGEGGARCLEFIEGTSSKFWEMRVEGTTFFTRYGKIGTAGQMAQKDFDSEAKAQGEAQKLIGEKTRKGYIEK